MQLKLAYSAIEIQLIEKEDALAAAASTLSSAVPAEGEKRRKQQPL